MQGQNNTHKQCWWSVAQDLLVNWKAKLFESVAAMQVLRHFISIILNRDLNPHKDIGLTCLKQWAS